MTANSTTINALKYWDAKSTSFMHQLACWPYTRLPDTRVYREIGFSRHTNKCDLVCLQMDSTILSQVCASIMTRTRVRAREHHRMCVCAYVCHIPSVCRCKASLFVAQATIEKIEEIIVQLNRITIINMYLFQLIHFYSIPPNLMLLINLLYSHFIIINLLLFFIRNFC